MNSPENHFNYAEVGQPPVDTEVISYEPNAPDVNAAAGTELAVYDPTAGQVHEGQPITDEQYRQYKQEAASEDQRAAKAARDEAMAAEDQRIWAASAADVNRARTMGSAAQGVEALIGKLQARGEAKKAQANASREAAAAEADPKRLEHQYIGSLALRQVIDSIGAASPGIAASEARIAESEARVSAATEAAHAARERFAVL